MKVKELDTSDIKSMLTSMENQVEKASGTAKEFLQEYYKDFINEAKAELLK